MIKEIKVRKLIYIPKGLYAKYSSFCDSMGMKISPRLAILMEKDLIANSLPEKPKKEVKRDKPTTQDGKEDGYY